MLIALMLEVIKDVDHDGYRYTALISALLALICVCSYPCFYLCGSVHCTYYGNQIFSNPTYLHMLRVRQSISCRLHALGCMLVSVFFMLDSVCNVPWSRRRISGLFFKRMYYSKCEGEGFQRPYLLWMLFRHRYFLRNSNK